MCMFGNGTVMTFSYSSMPTITLKTIGGLETSIVVEDATPLSQATGTHALKCFGGIIDHNPIELTGYFNANELATRPIPHTVLQTSTITFPDGAQASGQGQVVRFTTGQLSIGEVSLVQFQWQFRGGANGIIWTTAT